LANLLHALTAVWGLTERGALTSHIANQDMHLD
jgi:hypothetical protein